MTTAIYAILPNLRKNLLYDPVRDFVRSHASRPRRTSGREQRTSGENIAQLVKLAKEKPGALNYASAGVGTPAHLAGEMLNLLADIKVVHVPYKGAAPALADVIARQRANAHDYLAPRRGRTHERRTSARWRPFRPL